MLNLTISDADYNRLGLTGEQVTFFDISSRIRKDLMRQNLNKCVALAAQYGLATMTMDDITREVKAVRQQRYAQAHC